MYVYLEQYKSNVFYVHVTLRTITYNYISINIGFPNCWKVGMCNVGRWNTTIKLDMMLPHITNDPSSISFTKK